MLHVLFYLVYLYGYASDKDYRKSVPQIRSGEYEGLFEKVGYHLHVFQVFQFSGHINQLNLLIYY